MTTETATDNPTVDARSISSVPAYQRIAEDIRARVADGRLPAGTMLASRHNLAKQYGVALSTAQQAIANLIADGTLNTLDRRGTFVAHRRPAAGDAPVVNGAPHGEAVTTADFAAKSLRSNGTLAPAAQAISLGANLALPSASATLGIVATSLIDEAASPDVGSLWARQAIRALEEVFSVAGGTTIFFDRYPDGRGAYDSGIDDPQAISMTEAILSLRARGADVLAIVGLCDGRDVSDEIVAAVDVETVPVVYISWHEMRPPVAQVFYDSGFAGYQAAQHLLRKGYSRLIFLAPFEEAWLMERIDGARDAVRHAGLPQETLQVFPAEPVPARYDPHHAARWTVEAARDAFAHFGVFAASADSAGPWGVIAPNDFTASAVLQAASETGHLVGSEYGLIGFDDDPLSCSVGLTTIRPPVEEMGKEAGRLLLRALSGERGGLQVRLRSQIIPRASTAANLGVSSARGLSPNRRPRKAGF
jgi:DNA-binding LacI/PurR family transcriptional regulator/DNA-binding transcriptional regulator YhcF (GntR family)